MNYTGPKVKLSRKLGLNLTPKSQKYTAKKPYPPGQHGKLKRRAKMSDFARQLLEKQKLRYQYNVSERQMVNYFKKASKRVGNTGEFLLQYLESRLDALVYRAGLAPTIYAARQLVTHGHILVNGRRVNVPSYLVRPNSVVSVKESSRKIPMIVDSIRSVQPPPYIDLVKADFTFKYLYVPPKEEIPVQVELPQVVEYYAR
ncbi:MAG: 30S ribosomal protein S4 [Candidatus Kapaibacterium sp.]|nr:MAG: 30S ribosomal protein S4 [Candidatus Kapabacteria bacterium]ROL56108.1 MAG: 30S ribosomal protein S4 [Bacteroidetes/Chlorobi group bacterium Naka2016]